MNEEQRHILQRYEEMCDRALLGRDRDDTQRAFVSLLFGQRELAGCYFFTSHGTLCISRFRTHRESSDNPLLTVRATGGTSLHLALRIPLPSKFSGVARSTTHETYCAAERALDEFDYLYRKFLDAHEAPHQTDGEV